MPGSAPTSDLTGWRRAPFAAAGIRHDVHEKGEGPGVVLVPELPGLTPQTLALADHLVTQGFTVSIPSILGTPGRAVSAPYLLSSIARLCVAREFRTFAVGANRPVAHFLRGLAADLAGRTPGRGVGVIGMCFSGSFALAAAVEPAVTASVLSQPSTPPPLTPSHRRDPGVSEPELLAVATRTREDGLRLLGLRFSEDRGCPQERFAVLRARLGDAFEVVELDSSPGNPGGFSRTAHSVLTNEVREVPGHPSLAARARVVEFLRSRLGS